ncbi:hypothetical protein BRE01_46220 [Brevibacillus reuszeri]|uniref:Uncharacterized protein n=1 Tax=Brevibacillus reuszeri TaxID=54915 RepID=A0A0K9YLA5_9BACL|nr:hypothetical protein [Brevibacillus reuszeri]KNB69474.1 hypothetical protein ADS79_26710 [Brevibacillus reuszeri]MED1861544.1 hypothetical protein [Brevibacillus reuszeri]GED70920.1 hypothetical protein BRE01_46220 [Brevibacillus reuszeri]
MEPNDLVKEWLIWHQAVKYIQNDLSHLESVSMTFPELGTSILRHLGSQMYKQKKLAANELQKNGIRVIKEKEEANEVLIVWSQRGQVDILREHELTLRLEVQKRLKETKQKFIDERTDIQPLSLESVIHEVFTSVRKRLN